MSGPHSKDKPGSLSYGLTAPISEALPTAEDLASTRELEEILKEAGLYESEEDEQKRKSVLVDLGAVINDWVQKVAQRKNLTIQDFGARLMVFGSYRLGVHDPEADMDTLCVCPRHVTRNEFFGRDELGLQAILGAHKEVTEMQAITDAYVPVMKFKFRSFQIDLLYARLDVPVIEDNLDILDTDSLDHQNRSVPFVCARPLRLTATRNTQQRRNTRPTLHRTAICVAPWETAGQTVHARRKVHLKLERLPCDRHDPQTRAPANPTACTVATQTVAALFCPEKRCRMSTTSARLCAQSSCGRSGAECTCR
jgi:predicted nucleotidyltransferase